MKTVTGLYAESVSIVEKIKRILDIEYVEDGKEVRHKSDLCFGKGEAKIDIMAEQSDEFEGNPEEDVVLIKVSGKKHEALPNGIREQENIVEIKMRKQDFIEAAAKM